MASQVTDVVGHYRTNPERGELLGTHRSQERRNPDQECRPPQPLTLGGPRPGLGRLDVERQGKLRRQAGRDQRVAGNRLDQLSRQGGLAPRDPAPPIDPDQLGVRTRPDEDQALSARVKQTPSSELGQGPPERSPGTRRERSPARSGRAHVSCFFLAFGCGESDVERNKGCDDQSGWPSP